MLSAKLKHQTGRGTPLRGVGAFNGQERQVSDDSVVTAKRITKRPMSRTERMAEESKVSFLLGDREGAKSTHPEILHTETHCPSTSREEKGERKEPMKANLFRAFETLQLQASNPKLRIAVNLTSDNTTIVQEDDRGHLTKALKQFITPPASNEQSHPDSTYQEVHISQFGAKEEFIFVFGGFSAKGFLNSVEVLDVRRGIWRNFKEVIQGRTQGTAVAISGTDPKVFLVGGRSQTMDETASI